MSIQGTPREVPPPSLSYPPPSLPSPRLPPSLSSTRVYTRTGVLPMHYKANTENYQFLAPFFYIFRCTVYSVFFWYLFAQQFIKNSSPLNSLDGALASAYFFIAISWFFAASCQWFHGLGIVGAGASNVVGSILYLICGMIDASKESEDGMETANFGWATFLWIETACATFMYLMYFDLTEDWFY